MSETMMHSGRVQGVRLVILLAAAGGGISAQQEKPAVPAVPPVTIVLPQGMGSGDVRYSIFRTGSFGTSGASGNLDRNSKGIKRTGPDQFAIDATTADGSAASMQAILYSPAYGFALVDVPSLTNETVINVPLKPPVPIVQLIGRVTWPADHPVSTGVTIHVSYVPTFECKFFSLPDCMLTSMRMASTTLGPDNQFVLDVPDFAADPALQRFSSKGMLVFEAATRSTSYRLRVSGEKALDLPVERARDLVTLTVNGAEQPAPVPVPRVVVQFPPGLLSPQSEAHFFMRGSPSWGYGTGWSAEQDPRMAPEVRRTGPDELTLDASRGGKPASAVKAWFYMPAYGFALIDVDQLIPGATRVVGVPERAPSNRITLAGRVVPPAGVSASGMTIDLWYLADWTCEFFVLMDCGVGGVHMGSLKLAPDGAFSFDVPDFSLDPSLQTYRNKGSFHFSAHTRTTDYDFKEVSILQGLPLAPSQTSLFLTAVKRQFP